MLPYLVKRLSLVVPTILAVLVITFFLLRASGSPVDEILGEKGGTPEQRRMLEHELGLDRPLARQFVDYFARLFRGDMGTIVSTRTPVARELARRLPNTIKLAFAAMLLASVVGVASGVLSARFRDSALDVAVRFVTFCFISTPIFWFGIMLIFVFAYLLGWVPASATGQGGWTTLVLPIVALRLRPASFIARVTRSSMLEVLRQDYIRTERAKGLSERLVIYRHAVRNAMIPVVTVIALNFGLLLAGALLTETVFAWPGIGRYVVRAVGMRDYPVVQGCVMFFALIFVVVNLIADVLYVYIDPRIKYK